MMPVEAPGLEVSNVYSSSLEKAGSRTGNLSGKSALFYKYNIKDIPHLRRKGTGTSPFSFVKFNLSGTTPSIAPYGEPFKTPNISPLHTSYWLFLLLKFILNSSYDFTLCKDTAIGFHHPY
jgi:hypothetical protein